MVCTLKCCNSSNHWFGKLFLIISHKHVSSSASTIYDERYFPSIGSQRSPHSCKLFLWSCWTFIINMLNCFPFKIVDHQIFTLRIKSTKGGTKFYVRNHSTFSWCCPKFNLPQHFLPIVPIKWFKTQHMCFKKMHLLNLYHIRNLKLKSPSSKTYKFHLQRRPNKTSFRLVNLSPLIFFCAQQ